MSVRCMIPMGRWSAKMPILLAVLVMVGCAEKRPSRVDIIVPPSCARSIRLVDCDLNTNSCHKAIVTRRRGCEQIVVKGR